jgi:hypothetical protein
MSNLGGDNIRNAAQEFIPLGGQPSQFRMSSDLGAKSRNVSMPSFENRKETSGGRGHILRLATVVTRCV